ncbi:hypothetical protein KNCP2_12180 [Candidatus Rickettsia kedanie]|uniref:Ankyrin repeat protein n=2 Tax=Candidatus Rickettsia kedanie TaxID=3115352 RepID=A0ABP9TZ61_9RICK
MKKQAEKIAITDDIIRNKFDEIFSGKDIEEQQIMGFNNIDDYFKAKVVINDSLISEEEKSVLSAKIKRHEFLREDFIKESKTFIEDPNINIRYAYKEAYTNTCSIAVMSGEFIVKAISQGNYDLVDNILTALKNVDPNTYASTLEHDFGSLLYFACKNNQKKIAKLLLEKGADINFSKQHYYPPLYSVSIYRSRTFGYGSIST